MVLNKKKIPKELYDWLIEEVTNYHEDNEDIIEKVRESDKN
jgi:hypothetical protein